LWGSHRVTPIMTSTYSIEKAYPVRLREALNDGEEKPGISFRVIRKTDAQSVHQHLVQTFGQQGLGQLTEVVFQHSCIFNTQYMLAHSRNAFPICIVDHCTDAQTL